MPGGSREAWLRRGVAVLAIIAVVLIGAGVRLQAVDRLRTVGQGSADWPKFAALVLLAIGPVVLVFVILQRALLHGSLYGTTEL